MAYDKVLTHTNNAWQGITQKPCIDENGIWREQNSMQVQVSGVWEEMLTGGGASHGYLFVDYSGNVYHTNNFNTYTQGTRISGINVSDIHHITYSETRHRWEVQMKTTYANLPDSAGMASMNRMCYYNTDSKAQGQWSVENVYPDGVTGPWTIYAETGEYHGSDAIRISVYASYPDFDGFSISSYITIYHTPRDGISFTNIDYINVGEDLVLSISMEYMYMEYGDPYYETVTAWINCSADTSRQFLQDGLSGCDLYALNGYEDIYYDVKFTAVSKEESGHGDYEGFIVTSDYGYGYRTDYNWYGTQRKYFSDGIDIYYCDGSNTYKVTDLMEPPSNWQYTLVDTGHGICGC